MAFAILPPEFFVQGIAGVVAVLTGGVVVAFLPIIIFFKTIKRIVKKNKKLIFFLIIQNLLIAVILGLFFYYKYYKPLYEDSYFFPKDSVSDINPLDRTIEPFYNKEEKEDEDTTLSLQYGVTVNEIIKRKADGINIYYLDIREKEEFQVGHVVGAQHIRHADIIDIETIKNIFNLKNIDDNVLFILYCHNGDRALYTAKHLDIDNIKYLIGGVEGIVDNNYLDYKGEYLSYQKIFDEDFQKNFQISATEAIDIINNKEDTFVIDMRLGRIFAEKQIKGSMHFLYNTMSTKEYEKRLEIVLKNKTKNILFIVDRYTELFYANLLIKRLIENHSFNEKQFFILFNQFHLLEKNSSLKFVGGYPQI